MSRSVVAGRHCDDTRGPQRRSLRRRKRYGGSRKARRSLPKFGNTSVAKEIELFVKAEDWVGVLLSLCFKYGTGPEAAALHSPHPGAASDGLSVNVCPGYGRTARHIGARKPAARLDNAFRSAISTRPGKAG